MLKLVSFERAHPGQTFNKIFPRNIREQAWKTALKHPSRTTSLPFPGCTQDEIPTMTASDMLFPYDIDRLSYFHTSLCASCLKNSKML